MDCARFDRRLDALLEGKCTASEWQGAEEHARVCARCRLLLDAMAGAGAEQDAGDAELLAASVIARTSGSTCEAARERLCDFVDRQLAEFDRELVGLHLSRCEDCSALAEALAISTAVLPGFAELAPPSALLPAVLAATARRPAAPSFADRLAGWLDHLAFRPRFSFEAAYVCTLLIAIAFGNPVAAFKETSARGISYAQPRVEKIAERVASGPLGSALLLRDELADRVRVAAPAVDRGTFARLAESVDAGWKWFTEYVVHPAKDGAARLLKWASDAFGANLSGGPRVTTAEGTTERQ